MTQPAPVSALSNQQILRAALVVLLGFVASGLLGVLRTAIISATFGRARRWTPFSARSNCRN